MSILVIISLAVGGSLLLGLAGLSQYVVERQRVARWRNRLKGAVEAHRAPSMSAALEARVEQLLRKCGSRWRRKDPTPLPLPNPFAAAGWRNPVAPEILQGAKLCGAVAAPPLGLVWSMLVLGTPTPVSVGLCFATALVGWYGPDIWLDRRIQSRQRKLLMAFPDALDLMVVCVEAGLSLDRTLNRVGQEFNLMHKELSDELQQLCLELRTGRSRQQALRNAGLRMQLEEVQRFMALLIQTERFGTSVGQALRIHAEGLRKRQDLRATELASKLPVKLLFPLIFFIFPGLFVVLLGPAVINGIRQLSTLLTP